LLRALEASFGDEQNVPDRYILRSARMLSVTGDLLKLDADEPVGCNSDPIDATIRDRLRNKVVMVTGAAGSIGSELSRQLLQCCPSKLILLDRSETGLFYLQEELADERTSICLADYTDADSMRGALAAHQVQVIFHAAAYKHVSLMESSPREALQNNVFGLWRFVNMAEDSGCEAFIFTSSDKAVNPTSVLGCTKRIGELILSSRPASRMRCVSVRFGNVLGSQGSVLPILKKQLAEGKPLTITHPEATRYFTTAGGAACLLLQATVVGQDRNILVLEMGEPVRIIELARTLVRFSGKPEGAVKIVFTGLRDGEKLHEQMFYDNELILDTGCARIKQTRSNCMGWHELKQHLDELEVATLELDDVELRSRMRRIVPEYAFETASQLC